MQLSLNQLPSHLKQPLAPIYLIYGEELLLRQEARDAIRNAAKQTGYQQYQRFDITTHFDWSQINYQCNSSNLFNEKTLIEINNPSGTFDNTADKVLTAYSQNPFSEKLILIVSGKLSTAGQKSSWFQTIKQRGIIISVPSIRPHELPRWIAQRMQEKGFTVDNASIQLLAELTEGNLLACHQAIEKLSLLFPNTLPTALSHPGKNKVACTVVTTDHITAVTNNQARFNLFNLNDYMLKGDSRKVLLVINNLQAEGIEPALLLWMITKELRQLIMMLTAINQGKSLEQTVAREWSARQPLYKAALNRLTLNKAKLLLQLAHKIDLIIKGLNPGNVWQQLLRLTLAIATGTDPFFPKLINDSLHATI